MNDSTFWLGVWTRAMIWIVSAIIRYQTYLWDYFQPYIDADRMQTFSYRIPNLRLISIVEPEGEQSERIL
jgi:hypothetical protein